MSVATNQLGPMSDPMSLASNGPVVAVPDVLGKAGEAESFDQLYADESV